MEQLAAAQRERAAPEQGAPAARAFQIVDLEHR
jgi:hypothetical protein